MTKLGPVEKRLYNDKTGSCWKEVIQWQNWVLIFGTSYNNVNLREFFISAT